MTTKKDGPDAVAEPVKKKAITFAYEMEVGGKSYKPDTTAEFSYHEALELVQAGRARWAEKEK